MSEAFIRTDFQWQSSVCRTLFNRCDNVVTEEKNRTQVEEHITSALKHCNYPAWSNCKAREDMQEKSEKRIKKASHKKRH